MRTKVLAALPYPVQVIVGLLAYRKNMATSYGQGSGRYSPEELSSFKRQAWESVNALLVEARRKNTENGEGDAVFWVLGGDGPTEADTTFFGFIASNLVCEAYVPLILIDDFADGFLRSPETKKILKSFPAVEDYARRIHDRYFPDYECWE